VKNRRKSTSKLKELTGIDGKRHRGGVSKKAPPTVIAAVFKKSPEELFGRCF